MSITNLPEEAQNAHEAEQAETNHLMDSLKDQAENLQSQAEAKLEEFKEQAEEKLEELKDVAGNLWNKVTSIFEGKEEEKKD